MSIVDSAVTKGILKRRTASRYVSRLVTRFSRLLYLARSPADSRSAGTAALADASLALHVGRSRLACVLDRHRSQLLVVSSPSAVMPYFRSSLWRYLRSMSASRAALEMLPSARSMSQREVAALEQLVPLLLGVAERHARLELDAVAELRALRPRARVGAERRDQHARDRRRARARARSRCAARGRCPASRAPSAPHASASVSVTRAAGRAASRASSRSAAGCPRGARAAAAR